MTAARAARDGVPGPGQVPAPEPSGRQAQLAGVDQLSATNAWAVGNSATGSPGEGNIDDQPLI